MSAYREKLLSLAAPRRRGSSRQLVERVENATVITTEHWDGRKDAIVRPDTARYETVQHHSGHKRGQVAEVRRKGAGG